MKLLPGARPLGSTALLTVMVLTTVMFSSSQVSGQGRGRGRAAAPAAQPAPSAQPSPQQGGGGWRGARWMDRNGDGKIDLSEVPDFMRGRFESTLRDAGLDPAHGISVDRYEELSRQRFAQSGGFGAIGAGPGRDERDRRRDERRDGQPQGGSSAQAAPEVRLVPGFGNEFEESPVASFGEAKDDESWQHDYDPSVIAMARDIIARYDTNKNGVLERSEWKAGQWRSDPNLSDRNKDGKLDLREMVERLAAQTKEDQRGRGPFGGQIAISLGGGNPGGAGGSPGGPGGRKQGFGGGDSFWRALDKNNDGRLDLAELAGNGWAQAAVRQAGFDPEKGVNLQEFLDARARSGGGARAFRGFGAGGPGGAFGGIGPGGFGNPTAAFGIGDPGDAGMDMGDGSGSGDTASDGTRKTGGKGNRGTAGASKPGAKKTEGATTASYRFQTAQELLPKDLPDWFLKKDKNGDGQVSMAEFSSTWTEAEVARFKQYDLNNDGIITAAEVLAVLAKSGRATSREDSDTTAREDRSDAASESAATTETKGESTPEVKPAETKPVSTSPPAAGTSGSPPSGPSAANIEAAKDYMKRYDKNKNGVLEIDEWWTSKLLPAAEADVNGDEKITEEELANYFQKRFPNR